MATSRTALRSLGVLAAASGLALASAGIASATTTTTDVSGTDVSVTFTIEDDADADTCGAALIPATAAPELLEGLKGEDLADILTTLADADGVTPLTDGESDTVTLGAESPEGTVTASDVDNGAYLLASLCTSDPTNPDTEAVTVGSPLDIISGLSSDGLLDTASALISGGDEDGLGAILSSALGDTETGVDAEPAIG